MLTACARLVLVDKETQRYIKQDDCGYPYEVDYPYQACMWDSKEEALESKRDWHPGNISGAIMPKRAADVIRGIKTDDVLERISNATGNSAVEPGSGS